MHSGLHSLTESGVLKDWLAIGRPLPQHRRLSVGPVAPLLICTSTKWGLVFFTGGFKKCLTLHWFAKENTETQPPVMLTQHKDFTYPALAFQKWLKIENLFRGRATLLDDIRENRATKHGRTFYKGIFHSKSIFKNEKIVCQLKFKLLSSSFTAERKLP